MTPFTDKKFSLSHVVKNISSLKENENNFTVVEEHFGLHWKLCVVRRNPWLCFYLYCNHACEEGHKWSVKAKYHLNVSSSTSEKSVQSTGDVQFGNGEKADNWGKKQFMKWEEMEKNYMVDGNLNIGASVSILEIEGVERKKLRNFDESMNDFSDVVLVVEEEKFYVSKLFLAAQCEYFEGMFLRNFEEANKKEVTLNEVDAYYFQLFLELLYLKTSVNDDTVDGILSLGDMFLAPVVMEICETFLVRDSRKTSKEKLEIANRYKFEKLKNHCLDSINTAEEIRSVMLSDVNEMDPTVVGRLLQKALVLIPNDNNNSTNSNN